MPAEVGALPRGPVPLTQVGYDAAYGEWEASAASAEGATAAEGGALAVGGAAAGAVIGFIAIVAAGVIIKLKINDENKKREAYTQQFVQEASKKYPRYNVVICHPNHTVSPGKGSYVVHQHFELGMTSGTCGYDVYFAPKGKPFTFEI